ncbi:MAG: PAC2 family protein [DPANN group archaeon]|nr:PAC2 family protein [DPANN group archaeon]
MTKFIIQKKFDKLPRLRNPILIEGLPGMGQVAKIAVDFLIDSLKPTLLYKIHSYDFWHSVYFNENGLLELPAACIYYKKGKKQDILLLAGDDQPNTPRASYEFAEKIIDFVAELGCKEVITLGGLGQPSEVKNPKVFGAVTSKDVMKKYSKLGGVNFKLNNKIEAIVGASGLLLGLAQLRGIKGIALLAETYGHPTHLGFIEAKELLGQLQKILGISLNLKELDKESEEYKKEQAMAEDGPEQDIGKLHKLKTQFQDTKPDIKYIS